MVLLRWLSSWFLISRETFKVHQKKKTLDLAIHSSCLRALHDRGCLRLKQVISREFKATSPPSDFLPSPPRQPSTCLRGMLSLANGPQTLKEFDMTNLRQTWPVHWLSQSKTNGRHHAFSAPSPSKDWHGGPFPTHGELAQVLSLRMRPTRTASFLCLFSPQWPETWLSPGSCANILGRFEVCFQKFG